MLREAVNANAAQIGIHHQVHSTSATQKFARDSRGPDKIECCDSLNANRIIKSRGRVTIVRKAIRLALCASLIVASIAVHAQGYPTRPVRLVVPTSPEEFAAVIRDDLKKWAKVTKDAGYKPQELNNAAHAPKLLGMSTK